MDATTTTTAKRAPDGKWLPGISANPAGKVAGASPSVSQLREKYGHRIPELIENLFVLTKTGSEATKLAANRELLDRIVGKPVQTVEAVSARFDVGAMYLAALQRASQRAHAVSSEPVIDGSDDNSNAGAPHDPTGIIQ